MLLQYASSIGKGNMRYIEKTGIRWSDEGIDSLELAERKIRSWIKAKSLVVSPAAFGFGAPIPHR